MWQKLSVVLFVIAVLITSVVASTLPAANALTKNTFNDSHSTARFGNSPVCGDHICAAGEHQKMMEDLTKAQMAGKGTTKSTNPTTAATQGQVSSSVCQTVKTTLSNAGVSSAVIGKVMTDLGCS